MIDLAERRAFKIGRDIAAVQAQINAAARTLIGGRPAGVRLERLLDDLDRHVADLGRNAPRVADEFLRAMCVHVVATHARWSKARLGSDEERAAASEFLDGVDQLAAYIAEAG